MITLHKGRIGAARELDAQDAGMGVRAHGPLAPSDGWVRRCLTGGTSTWK